MSFSTCLCGGKILLTPTIEKIIFLSSLMFLLYERADKDNKNPNFVPLSRLYAYLSLN